MESKGAATATSSSNPDDVWRQQYVQGGGWGDAKARATATLLSTFLAKREAQRDVATALVSNHLPLYKSVSHWVADRGFDLVPSRLAIRTPDWYWQLIRSFVLRRDCVTGYVPKTQSQSRQHSKEQRLVALRRRAASRGQHRLAPPAPTPLPDGASLETQYAALVQYRNALRGYLQQEEDNREAAELAAADGGLESHESLLSDPLGRRSTIGSATDQHADLGRTLTSSNGTSPMLYSSAANLNVSQRSGTAEAGLLVAIRDLARQEVADEIVAKAGAEHSLSKHALNSLLSDDEAQRAIAQREVELLAQTVEQMNDGSRIAIDERVELPPEAKLARRHWYGQRLRDGAFLNERYAAHESHLALEREKQAAQLGRPSPVRVRRPPSEQQQMDSPARRTATTAGADDARVSPSRTITVAHTPGATVTVSVPRVVSDRGILACSPASALANNNTRSSTSSSRRGAKAQGNTSPTSPQPAGDPTADSRQRLKNVDEEVCVKVRGTTATRCQTAMGRLRRTAATPLSGIPPPARPRSRQEAQREAGAPPSQAAARSATPTQMWRLAATEGDGVWQRASPLPHSKSGGGPPPAGSPSSGHHHHQHTPLVGERRVVARPALPVVDWSRRGLSFLAQMLRVPPRAVDFKSGQDVGGACVEPTIVRDPLQKRGGPADPGAAAGAVVLPSGDGDDPSADAPEDVDDDVVSRTGGGDKATDQSAPDLGANADLNVRVAHDPNWKMFDFGPARNASAAVVLKQRAADAALAQQRLNPLAASSLNPTAGAVDGTTADMAKSTSPGLRRSTRTEDRGGAAGSSVRRTGSHQQPQQAPPDARRVEDVCRITRQLPPNDARLFMDSQHGDLISLFIARGVVGSVARTRRLRDAGKNLVAPPKTLPCGVLLLNGNKLRSTRSVAADGSSSPSSSATVDRDRGEGLSETGGDGGGDAAAVWGNHSTVESTFAGLRTTLSLVYGSRVWQAHLSVVDLSENRLTDVPLELRELPALRSLKLHGNRIGDSLTLELIAASLDLRGDSTGALRHSNSSAGAFRSMHGSSAFFLSSSSRYASAGTAASAGNQRKTAAVALQQLRREIEAERKRYRATHRSQAMPPIEELRAVRARCRQQVARGGSSQSTPGRSPSSRALRSSSARRLSRRSSGNDDRSEDDDEADDTTGTTGPTDDGKGLGHRLQTITLFGNPMVDNLGREAYHALLRVLFPLATSIDGARVVPTERDDDETRPA